MTNKFLLKNPIITEKAVAMSSIGKYVFLVEKFATKNEVKKALKNVYSVDAVRVQIVNTKPKNRRLGRSLGTIPGYKKAMVTLKEGQKLDIIPQ